MFHDPDFIIWAESVDAAVIKIGSHEISSIVLAHA